MKYTTGLGQAQTVYCHEVVTTCGAYALPALLPFIQQSLMSKISNLFYAPIVQVGVGIKDTQGVSLNAFGGLVPSCEKQQVLGILFPSSCFENRAPVSYTHLDVYKRQILFALVATNM